MTAPADFQCVIRNGRRRGTGTLVAHYWCCAESAAAPRVGFAVSKAVGGSVTRHRVARQLRHLCRAHLASLAPGSLLVIRANPAASHCTADILGRDLERALAAVVGPR